jgi:hypothetical protein
LPVSWKTKFPLLWQRAYAGTIEPDPATVTYDKLLSDLALKLKTDSSFVTTVTGPAGAQGPAGAIGPIGPQGPAGTNGTFSASQIPTNSITKEMIVDRTHSIMVAPTFESPMSYTANTNLTVASDGLHIIPPTNDFIATHFSFVLPNDYVGGLKVELIYLGASQTVRGYWSTPFAIQTGEQNYFDTSESKDYVLPGYSGTIGHGQIYRGNVTPSVGGVAGGIYSLRLVIYSPMILTGMRVTYNSAQ